MGVGLVGPEVIGSGSMAACVAGWNVWSNARARHTPRFGHSLYLYPLSLCVSLCDSVTLRGDRCLLVSLNVSPPHGLLIIADNVMIERVFTTLPAVPAHGLLKTPHHRHAMAAPATRLARVGRAPRATPERRHPRTDIRTDTAAASTPARVAPRQARARAAPCWSCRRTATGLHYNELLAPSATAAPPVAAPRTA